MSNEVREWWLIPDNKVLPGNRRHWVMDNEQASEYQAEWDGEFGPPKNAFQVVEKSAYDKLKAERDKLELSYYEYRTMFDGECETHQKNNAFHEFQIEALKATAQRFEKVLKIIASHSYAGMATADAFITLAREALKEKEYEDDKQLKFPGV